MSDFHSYYDRVECYADVLIINSAIKQLPPTYIFHDGTEGIGITI